MGGNQASVSECGEFRSIIVQKRNGSIVECNISPRSSADSCYMGSLQQKHRETIISAIWVSHFWKTQTVFKNEN